MNRKKAKAKPKPKRKRQWKLNAWVAVPTRELQLLWPRDLGDACRKFLCGRTKALTLEHLKDAIMTEEVDDINYTILHLDIIATARYWYRRHRFRLGTGRT